MSQGGEGVAETPIVSKGLKRITINLAFVFVFRGSISFI